MRDGVHTAGDLTMRTLLAFLTLLLLPACSALLAAVPPDSGIEGQVFIGPMCPVVVAGQDCPDAPYQATLDVLTRSGRRVARVETDETGRFRIALAAGDYVIRSGSTGGIPFAKPLDVVVRPGEFTRVMVHFDSGIR
jgi:hypothetical protein